MPDKIAEAISDDDAPPLACRVTTNQTKQGENENNQP
jgi:hypothetical protein